MEALASPLIAGALLGLAGALHCAAMCGGLAGSGMLVFSPKSRAQTALTLLAMMSGRIIVYAALGALVAGSVEFLGTLLSSKPSMVPMPWIGAVLLVWIGLSTAGFFPVLAFPTSGVTALVYSLDRLLEPLRRMPYLAPFVTGMVWGLAPCPLIYAALLTATLTGSTVNGFLMMLGFGIGTLPAVMLAALGIKVLAKINAGPLAKIAAGLAIAGFGVATVFLHLPVFNAFCAPV